MVGRTEDLNFGGWLDSLADFQRWMYASGGKQVPCVVSLFMLLSARFGQLGFWFLVMFWGKNLTKIYLQNIVQKWTKQRKTVTVAAVLPSMTGD